MKPLPVLMALSAWALGTNAASAAPVNLGNLAVYNAPLTIQNFNGPAGGPYTKFVFSTDWAYGSGTATSNAAAWSLGNPINSIVAGFTSVAGTAANGNPTTITITDTLSVGVTPAMALQFVAAQNPFSIGNYSVSAFWSNTTLNFYVPKPPPPTPSGVINMGDIHPPSGQWVTVDTGGSDFDPAVAVYGADGLLLGTNASSGAGLPGSALEGMRLRPGDYYVFVSGAGALFGDEDLIVDVPPGTPGGTLGGGINGTAWPNPVVTPDVGQWFAFHVTPPACPGDLDADGHTDVFDFAIFAGNFGQTLVPPFTGGDIDGNGRVDVLDFASFAESFGCDDPGLR